MPLTKVSFSVIQVANNVTSTTVGNTTSIPSITFDQNGVITSASNNTLLISNVTSTTVGNTTSIPSITFDQNGRIAAVSNNAVAIPAGFDTGTVLLFYQAAAPTGWTQVTSQNNKALRVVSGTGGGTGGTTGFSTVFANTTVTTSISVSGTTGATTLSTAQIPSHTHSYSAPGGLKSTSPGDNNTDVSGSPGGGTTGAEGGGGSHTHSFSGSGSGTSSAITLNVQYIDIILASKN